jgi:hypothetical protein
MCECCDNSVSRSTERSTDQADKKRQPLGIRIVAVPAEPQPARLSSAAAEPARSEVEEAVAG